MGQAAQVEANKAHRPLYDPEDWLDGLLAHFISAHTILGFHTLPA